MKHRKIVFHNSRTQKCKDCRTTASILRQMISSLSMGSAQITKLRSGLTRKSRSEVQVTRPLFLRSQVDIKRTCRRGWLEVTGCQGRSAVGKRHEAKSLAARNSAERLVASAIRNREDPRFLDIFFAILFWRLYLIKDSIQSTLIQSVSIQSDITIDDGFAIVCATYN